MNLKLTTKFGVFDLTVTDAEHAYVGLPQDGYVTIFGVEYNVSMHLKFQEGWTGKGDERAKQWTVMHLYTSRKGNSFKHATPAAQSAIRKAVVEAFVEMTTQCPRVLGNAEIEKLEREVEDATKAVADAKQAVLDAQVALTLKKNELVIRRKGN